MARMTVRAVAIAAVLVAGMTGVAPVPVHAAPPADAAVNHVYYTVTADRQGKPANLWEIAARFLGDENRAGEIFDLNTGRLQPDGGRLADPGHLSAGWQLVLPWDAVGAGLQYGPLKQAVASSGCAWDTDVPAAAAWGQTLLAPSRAWSVADGSGVTVAVVGSGVDGSAPALAGRVLAGADVAAGTGPGDTAGCAGSGTALAGIVAGDDGARGATFGVAPGTRILPVAVGTAAPAPRAAATAVGVAVASGATVVLIGADVATADPAVRAAVNDAIARDVVVVLPPSDLAEPADGLLRVGAIAADRRPADAYPAHAVDLLGPGVGVAAIGPPGSGAEYAAAFVAGTVALVRSAHPELRAADVTRQVLATLAGGVVNPVAAVTAPLPDGVGVHPAAAPPASALRTLSQALLWIAAGLAALLPLAYVLRHAARLLTRVAAHRRGIRQARLARARMADDADDPFWEPPTDDPAGADRGEVTEAVIR